MHTNSTAIGQIRHILRFCPLRLALHAGRGSRLIGRCRYPPYLPCSSSEPTPLAPPRVGGNDEHRPPREVATIVSRATAEKATCRGTLDPGSAVRPERDGPCCPPHDSWSRRCPETARSGPNPRESARDRHIGPDTSLASTVQASHDPVDTRLERVCPQDHCAEAPPDLQALPIPVSRTLLVAHHMTRCLP
jgi:hypothetical protein